MKSECFSFEMRSGMHAMPVPRVHLLRFPAAHLPFSCCGVRPLSCRAAEGSKIFESRPDWASAASCGGIAARSGFLAPARPRKRRDCRSEHATCGRKLPGSRRRRMSVRQRDRGRFGAHAQQRPVTSTLMEPSLRTPCYHKQPDSQPQTERRQAKMGRDGGEMILNTLLNKDLRAYGFFLRLAAPGCES